MSTSHGITALLLGAALAAPAHAAENPGKIRTLVMDLKSNGVDADTVAIISGLIAVALDDDERLEVLSGADVRQLIELESQKQALGCADDSSCLADVAGALGAELVVFGAAGKLGRLYNLNINLYDSTQSRSVGRVAVQAGSVEELPAQLKPALQTLVKKALATRPAPTTAAATTTTTTTTPPATTTTEPAADPTARTDAIETPPPGSGPGMLPFVVAGVGAGAFVLGAVGVAVSFVPVAVIAGAESRYADPNLPASDRLSALEEAQNAHATWGVLGPAAFVGGSALALVGLAGIGAGLAWAVVGGGE